MQNKISKLTCFSNKVREILNIYNTFQTGVHK